MTIPLLPSSGSGSGDAVAGTGYGTPASASTGQVTVAEIEQHTAPRLGPYRQIEVDSTTGTPSATIVYFAELKSTADPGGIENLYMLRRGQKADGTTVSVAAGDRQRIAQTYDALQGSVAPDRAWGVAPEDGELIEFHHTDPTHQLRVAVRAGLRRCFFETRESVTLAGAAAERDLSAVVGWLTRRSQIRRVQFSQTGSTAIPGDQSWWNAFESGGHVWLAGWRDLYPNTLLVTALRPHFTWVNGATSTTGPTVDADVLDVDLDYAAAAAHIEAWRLFPAVLKQAAEAGYQASQEEAAREFTRLAASSIRRRPREFGLSAPFNPVGMGSHTP